MSVDVTQLPVSAATNFLVPSSGGTHAVQVALDLVAGTPNTLDWRQLANADFPFQPQGVFVDNSVGTNPLTIAISSNGGGNAIWTAQVKAGDMAGIMFPAPNGQFHTINGAGEVNLVYVDFPVLPFFYTP